MFQVETEKNTKEIVPNPDHDLIENILDREAIVGLDLEGEGIQNIDLDLKYIILKTVLNFLKNFLF